MVMVGLAIVTGVLTLLNYYWQSAYDLSVPLQVVSVVAQAVLLTGTILAAVAYQGRRSRPSYGGGWYRIWTFRFAIIVLSLLGNVCVLVVLVLHLAGLVDQL